MAQNRDEKGRFIAGNNANPKGRPPKKREEEYLNITLSAVTPGDWAEIIRKAVWQAKKGDGPARKFLADHLLGLPIQKTDLTVTDRTIIVTLADNDGDPDD